MKDNVKVIMKIPEDRARNSFSAPASVLSNRRLRAVLAPTSLGSSVAFRFVEVTSRFETNSFRWSRASGISSSSESKSDIMMVEIKGNLQRGRGNVTFTGILAERLEKPMITLSN